MVIGQAIGDRVPKLAALGPEALITQLIEVKGDDASRTGTSFAYTRVGCPG